jgi:small ligand-binding sensory domain FIST
MPFLSLSSTLPNTQAALDEIATGFAAGWSGDVDLAIAFFSKHHLEGAERIAKGLSALCKPRALFGCPGETVIEGDRELEEKPALALWLAKWRGDVKVAPYHLTFEQTADGASLLGWPDELGDADPARSLLITLGDPFTFPTDDFLQQSNDEKPGLPVVGGMASAAQQPGINRLLLGDKALDQGAVGVLLQGEFGRQTIVSQGCRPIGKPLVVTKAHHNLLLELGGKPALAQLQELWQTLDPHEQELVQEGLHVGRVTNEYQGAFERGDFLVRNVMGIDQKTGGIAITDRARVGQTVQFHVRDAATADEDLNLLVRKKRSQVAQPGAALLFSCNGRGTRLFSETDHDAKAIHAAMGAIPLAGFFAMGELGPIGGRNFIHGFTASMVVFDE